MIYLVLAAILTFLFFSFIIFAGTDSFWAVAMFWGTVIMVALIVWLTTKGVYEVSGQ